MGRSGGAARAAAWGMVAGVVERALLSSSGCAPPDLSPVFGARWAGAGPSAQMVAVRVLGVRGRPPGERCKVYVVS
jgi:hypothetical protein